MNKKILSITKISQIAKHLRDNNQKLVLVGGCFDILHLGHVLFLEKAKKTGAILLVWVESDESVRQRKGAHRPIHTQKERAAVIAALSCVDYVLLLPQFMNNQQYDNLVKKIKPAIIAATKGDPEISYKKRAAKLVEAKVVYVTKNILNKSTSTLAKRIEQEEYL